MSWRIHPFVAEVPALLGARGTVVLLLLAAGTLAATVALALGDGVLAGFLLLAGVLLAALANTKGITDVNFIFLGLFAVYQLLCPVLYYYEVSWVYGIQWVTDKHNVYLYGSLIGVAAIAAYTLGGGMSRFLASRPVAVADQWLPRRRALNVALVLIAISLCAWLVVFSYANFPLENFMGRPPADRHRGYFDGLFAHGYLLTLPFQMNVALLLLLVYRPQLAIYGPVVLLMFYATVVFNSMAGARLVLFLSPLAFIMMKNLLVESDAVAGRVGVHYRRPLDGVRGYPWWLLFGAGGGIYFFSLFYAYYRSGIGGDFLKEVGWFNFTNIFDTSITFQFVLDKVPQQFDYWWGAGMMMPFLRRVPTVLFPDKYDYMFDHVMFTHLLYGYDQRDPDSVSRAASMFADLFLNFGVIGLVLVIGLFGLFNGWLRRCVERGAASNLFLVLYVVYAFYYLPFLFKAGFFPSFSHIDVKLVPLLGTVVLLVLVDRWRNRAVAVGEDSHGWKLRREGSHFTVAVSEREGARSGES